MQPYLHQKYLAFITCADQKLLQLSIINTIEYNQQSTALSPYFAVVNQSEHASRIVSIREFNGDGRPVILIFSTKEC